MNEIERRARIGELRRMCVLLTALWDAIDERLDALEAGATPTPTAMDVRLALNHAASLIAAMPADEWGGWVLYLLKALGNEADEQAFHAFLGDLQVEISGRLKRDM